MDPDGPVLVLRGLVCPNCIQLKAAEPEFNREIQHTNKQSKILLYEKVFSRPKRDVGKAPVSVINYDEFPFMLNTFEMLVHIQNPSENVVSSIKSICKKFWSSIYIEFPMQSLNVDGLNKWMSLFLIVLKGQPADIEHINLKQWMKVKKWILKILNNLFDRFRINFRSYNKALANMLENNHGENIQDCCVDLLKKHVNGGDLPDKLVIQSLNFLTNSLLRPDMYKLLKVRLEFVLFDIIFPLLCFNDKDQTLWEDQFDYVKNTEHSPKTAVIEFLNVIVRKHKDDAILPFVNFLAGKLKSYDKDSGELIEHRQKDGALLAFGTISDRIVVSVICSWKILDFFRSYVLPEITCSVGHLKAKALWISGKCACFIVDDAKLREIVIGGIIDCMRDPKYYAVRFNSVIALKYFVEECDRIYCSVFTVGMDAFLPRLEDIINDAFKVMNEAVNTDLVYTIETIVETLAFEYIVPYALLLCQNLAKAFLEYIDLANDSSNEEVYDQAVSAALCCLRAILRTLEASSKSHFLLSEIEPVLLPIMRRMLTIEGREMYEEVLEIVSYMLAFPPSVSNDMWSLWPLIADAPVLWIIEYFPVISYILQNYILKDTQRFLTCKELDYQRSVWNIISIIMGDKEWKFNDIEPATKLMQTFFQNCKGKVDHWLKPYIRITVERLQRTEESSFKCLLLLVIGDALYYNTPSTLNILQDIGVSASEIFNLWLQMLQETKKNGRRANFTREEEKKVCCLGMTSLLSVDQLPGGVNLEQIYKANVDLLIAYKDQIQEMAKESEDGEDEDAYESSKANSEVVEPEFNIYDYYRIDTPIDDVDPFILFDDTLKGMEASKLENLRLTLDSHFQSLNDRLVQYTEH